MLFQLLRHHFDRFVELRVVAIAIDGWVEIDFDIRSDSVVLDLPFAVQTVDSSSRRGDVAAVDQLRVASNSYQASPSSFTNKGPQPRFAEIPGQRVSTGA